MSLGVRLQVHTVSVVCTYRSAKVDEISTVESSDTDTDLPTVRVANLSTNF
jgi:hypothetical protein